MKNKNLMVVVLFMIVSLFFVVSCEKKKVATDTGTDTKKEAPADVKASDTKDKNADAASKPIEEVVTKKDDDAAKLAGDENKAGVKESKAVRTEAGNDVFFDYDSATIMDSQLDSIKKEAEFMKANPKVTITIEGHCDDRGTEEYNIALGDRRAAAVKACLEKMGISGKRMNSVSFGKEKPLVKGHNEEAWAKNRRAHFVVN